MNNNRPSIRVSFFFWPIIFLFLLVSCSDIPDSGDAEEAMEISKFIQSHYDIKPEERQGLSGYHNPGNYSTEITIYRMESEKDQNELIELLRSEKKRRGWKTIKIAFYEKEIFNRSNGTEKRGEEKLLRTVRIN
jgi:hypothetical protein